MTLTPMPEEQLWQLIEKVGSYTTIAEMKQKAELLQTTLNNDYTLDEIRVFDAQFRRKRWQLEEETLVEMLAHARITTADPLLEDVRTWLVTQGRATFQRILEAPSLLPSLFQEIDPHLFCEQVPGNFEQVYQTPMVSYYLRTGIPFFGRQGAFVEAWLPRLETRYGKVERPLR